MCKRTARFLIVFVLSLLIGYGTLRPATAQTNVLRIPLDLLGYLMAVSPDGKLAAVAADTVMYSDAVEPALLPIRLIDLTNGKQIGQFANNQTDFAGALAFSPQGTQLVSIQNNGRLYVWDTASQKLLQSFVVPGYGQHRAQFMPDGKTLIILTNTPISTFLRINLQTGAIEAYFGPHFKTFLEYKNIATDAYAAGNFEYLAFAVAPDGKTIAAASFNSAIDIWNVNTDELIGLHPASADKANQLQLSIRNLQFSSDGTTLLYFDRIDNKLHLWDMMTRTERPLAVTGGTGFTLSQAGDSMAWIDKSTVYAAQVRGGDAVKVAELPDDLSRQRQLVMQFTADGKRLVIGNLAVPSGKNALYVVTMP